VVTPLADHSLLDRAVGTQSILEVVGELPMDHEAVPEVPDIALVM
jgi:hypothetical protein